MAPKTNAITRATTRPAVTESFQTHRYSAAASNAIPSAGMYALCSSTTSASGISAYAESGDSTIADKPTVTSGSVVARRTINHTTTARIIAETRNSGLYQ